MLADKNKIKNSYMRAGRFIKRNNLYFNVTDNGLRMPAVYPQMSAAHLIV